ncbi:MAG: hypothetical protein ACPIOQ_07820, partial [Promethearchaeia archaeon]
MRFIERLRERTLEPWLSKLSMDETNIDDIPSSARGNVREIEPADVLFAARSNNCSTLAVQVMRRQVCTVCGENKLII